jgi:hypothetical protein
MHEYRLSLRCCTQRWLNQIRVADACERRDSRRSGLGSLQTSMVRPQAAKACAAVQAGSYARQPALRAARRSPVGAKRSSATRAASAETPRAMRRLN